MKYLISFFVCVSALAAPIHVFYEEGPERALAVKEILTNEYKIPEDLIGLKGVQNCEELKKAGKLDLCLKNNGDLYVVSVDKNFVSESLKIFSAP